MDRQNQDILGFRREIIDIPEAWRPNIEDLPGDLKRIAEAIERHIPGQGVRMTLLIAQVFPGQTAYFRNPVKWMIAWRDDAMRAAYDQGGVTAKDLATITGLCTRQVEKILARPDSQAELKDKQLRLFE